MKDPGSVSGDVVVDHGPGVGIRLPPRFHTEDAELDRAFAAMDEVRETRAWTRAGPRSSLVT